MKSVFAALVVLVYVALSGAAGYCQDCGSSDISIEQSESQIDEKLDSEMASDQSQGEAEMDKANEEMNTGRPME